MTNTQQKKIFKPPYLSLSVLDKVISYLSTRRLDEVNIELLANYGIGKSDTYTAVVALKFLGLIDENDKTTEIAKKLHLQGEPRTKALQDIVRAAYSKLFEVIAEPQKLSPQELRNEMIAQYGLTPRIAKTAVPAFLWLCGEAGLGEKTVEPRKREATTKTENQGITKSGSYKKGSTEGIPMNKLEVIRDVLTSMKEKDKETITVVINGLKELLAIADEPQKNTNEDNEKGEAQ